MIKKIISLLSGCLIFPCTIAHATDYGAFARYNFTPDGIVRTLHYRDEIIFTSAKNFSCNIYTESEKSVQVLNSGNYLEIARGQIVQANVIYSEGEGHFPNYSKYYTEVVHYGCDPAICNLTSGIDLGNDVYVKCFYTS